ncbi:MAG: hypothetical protein WBB64_12175, partial [Anaerolineales bacterium]
MKKLFGDRQQKNNIGGDGKTFTQPESDTLGLVPVLKVLPDMLITTHGKYVQMYEFPPVAAEADSDQIFQIQRRYANVLASLPPRSKFQLTVIPEPIDPTPDLEHFFKIQQFWSSESAAQQTDTAHLNHENIEESARSFMALITNWYTSVNPITWRMIITVSYMPPYQKKGGLFGLGRSDDARVDDLVNNSGTAREYFAQHGGILLQSFQNQGIELISLDGPAMAQAVWRVLHPTTTGSQERSAASALQNVLDKDANQPSSYSVPDLSEFSPTLPMDYVAEVLAPDNVREDPNQIYVDGIYLKGYSVYDY